MIVLVNQLFDLVQFFVYVYTLISSKSRSFILAGLWQYGIEDKNSNKNTNPEHSPQQLKKMVNDHCVHTYTLFSHLCSPSSSSTAS